VVAVAVVAQAVAVVAQTVAVVAVTVVAVSSAELVELDLAYQSQELVR
jgi:hypothetical protein